MIETLQELRPGQFFVMVWKDTTGMNIKSGKIKKFITGTPKHAMVVDWDSGGNELFIVENLSTEHIHVVSTEQEKLALMLTLS